MPILKGHDSDSDAVKIEHDRQKTKRYQIYIGAITLLALVGVYAIFKSGSGKLDLNVKEGKFGLSIDKPIVSQENIPTKSIQTPNGEVKFTTGNVSNDFITKLENEQEKQFSPTSFAGQNYINKEAGFLFSVEHPEYWQVAYTPFTSLGAATIVNNFSTQDGNNFNIVIEQLQEPVDVVTYTKAAINSLAEAGMIGQMPEVSFDLPSNTAFCLYFNLTTGGASYQKYKVSGNRAYIATANASPRSTNQVVLADMIKMVTTFTLIGS